MKFSHTDRGFGLLTHPVYPPKAGEEEGEERRLAQSSSIILDYTDSWERAGTSALWIGKDHHLDREEVRQFIAHLTAWLETGSLELLELKEGDKCNCTK